jgi:hypothetical protein
MSQLDGAVILVLIIFLIILAILWFLLPFAVFGAKDLLRELIKEQKITNELLANKTSTSSQLMANRVKASDVDPV